MLTNDILTTVESIYVGIPFGFSANFHLKSHSVIIKLLLKLEKAITQMCIAVTTLIS